MSRQNNQSSQNSHNHQSNQNHNLHCIIYSRFSPLSKYLFDHLHPNVLSQVKTLCIDNPKVREALVNSDKISISEVPTILLVMPNNVVSKKYEGLMCLNYFRIPHPSNRAPRNKSKQTSIDSLLPKQSEQSEDEESGEEESNEPEIATRKDKMSRISIDTKRGVSVAKGEGHEKLQRSSLPEIIPEGDSPKKQKKGVLKKVKVTELQDLTELAKNDDEQIETVNVEKDEDDIIREARGEQPRESGKKKGVNVKKIMEEMQKGREEEDPKIPPSQRENEGPVKVKRVSFDE